MKGGRIIMYNLKINLQKNDELLSSEIKAVSENSVQIINSVGLLGNTEIIVAIIAATPSVLTQIAGVIKAYIERNNSNSFTLKIDDKEMSFTGYSTDEIDIILQKYGEQKD